MHNLTRRDCLVAGASALAFSQLPSVAFADDPGPLALTATTRTLDIDGRAATVWGLLGPNGPGLTLAPGQRFRVDLTNALDVPTSIHWHGQIPPNAQDGVPVMPLPMLARGETRSFDFAARPGTHWMHAHVPAHEMMLLAAPLIVHAPEDVANDRQEVVMFLHDFSFVPPEEVLARITGTADGTHGMDHSAHGMAGTDTMPMQGMMDMGGMAMDLNDHDWDAYLANDRTLSDPEVVTVDHGGRVRLRVINAAAATVFWIDTGELAATLAAVDGHPVVPLPGNRFGLAMGQRLDLLIDLPPERASWPILALREGARDRTGLILAAPGAKIRRIDPLAETEAPAFDFDLSQEARLVSRDPLPDRRADRSQMLMLGGSMHLYVWTIDGATWGNHRPVAARTGERVVLSFHNMSMMGHPMHLHGHVFQVVGLNGRRINGALRDTVYVPPMSMVDVALDAGEAARWMLHCHHMPHLSTGMMTEFAVTV